MKTLEVGQVVQHPESGQQGKIISTEQDGKWGLFLSTTGASFPVRAGEVEELDWQPGELEALLLERKPFFYSIRPTKCGVGR